MAVTKWKPTCGQTFYYISQSGTVSGTRAGWGADTVFKIATNNCFKTKRQALKVLKKILDDRHLPYFKFGTAYLVVDPLCRHIPKQYLAKPNAFQ